MNILRDFLFLKVIFAFALLSGGLLIQEIFTFLFIKPTFTSMSRSGIQPPHHPGHQDRGHHRGGQGAPLGHHFHCQLCPISPKYYQKDMNVWYIYLFI